MRRSGSSRSADALCGLESCDTHKEWSRTTICGLVESGTRGVQLSDALLVPVVGGDIERRRSPICELVDTCASTAQRSDAVGVITLRGYEQRRDTIRTREVHCCARFAQLSHGAGAALLRCLGNRSGDIEHNVRAWACRAWGPESNLACVTLDVL